MATLKKTADSSEAALAAIEDALRSEDAGGDAPVDRSLPSADIAKGPDQSPPSSIAGDADILEHDGPRLPNIDEADSFGAQIKVNVKDASRGSVREAAKDAPPTDFASSAKEFQHIEGGVNAVQAAAKRDDLPLSTALPSTALPSAQRDAPRTERRKTEAPATQEPKRASVIPANDDRKSSVGEILSLLRAPLPNTPYIIAAVVSLVWMGAVSVILGQNDGYLYAADGRLRGGYDAAFAIAGMVMLLPALFFFAMAGLQRRAQEMRVSSRVMAEIAARLAEPEVVGAEAVFTLGQAVRREVSSIGDGIERAISRASELETLVHGEVAALERSYADNEYKMRGLVSELGAEREAIMSTATRIQQTIEAVHKGFSNDIAAAGSGITTAIEDAGSRFNFMIGNRQDEIVATLDRSGSQVAEIIGTQTHELAERLAEARLDAASLFRQTGDAIIADIGQAAGALSRDIGKNADHLALGIAEASQKTGELTQRLHEAASQAALALETAGDTVLGKLSVTGSTLVDEMTGISTRTQEIIQQSGDGLIQEWRSATEDTAALLRTITQDTTGLFRSSAMMATDTFRESAGDVVQSITERLAGATSTLREAGVALKAEFDETSAVVNSAFAENGRMIMETVGSRAVEINDVIRGASDEFIVTLETRGLEAARLIEDKAQHVADSIAMRSLDVAERIQGAAAAIETTVHQNADSIETSLDYGTQRLASLLSTHADQMALSLNDVTARVDETLGEKILHLGQMLESGADRLSGMVSTYSGEMTRSLNDASDHISQNLASQTRGLDHSLEAGSERLASLLSTHADQMATSLTAAHERVNEALLTKSVDFNGVLEARLDDIAGLFDTHIDALSGTIIDRVESATAAFSIAGESLGQTISRTLESSSETLSAKMQDISQILAQNTAQATDTLARCGGDVVLALTQHATKVNDALLVNAMRLSETVAERTESLSQNFSSFETTFIDMANSLENTVSVQGEALATKLENSTVSVKHSLENLLGRIEDGLDSRAKSLGDTLALRSLEFTRVMGESSSSLLDGLDRQVEAFELKISAFSDKVVDPLQGHILAMEGKAEAAAGQIGERLEKTAEAISSRALEVERGLSALSRDVTSVLVSQADQVTRGLTGKADEIIALFDGKGAQFIESFDGRGRALVEGLERSTEDMTQRVTHSLSVLNEAINSGSVHSLNGLVDANDTLRVEVSGLLGRLGEANQILNAIVGSAAKNLDEIETRMSDRVRGLEATLAAILSAASQGTDALVSKIDAIRGASGDVLQNSHVMSQSLDERTQALQSLAQQLAHTQQSVDQNLAERQVAFESLTNTLNTRLEDVDSMLRSFAAIVHDQLTEAQTRARETSSLVHETAETATQAINAQFERVRLETGKERERTGATLRAAYEQANTEMSMLFQRTLDGFSATAAQLRAASQEVIQDLEQTRLALQTGGLEIPREARDATSQLKRVVTDQMRALNELTDIVSRSSIAVDVADPRRREPRLPDMAPPPRPASPPPRPVAPPATPPSGGSWLSGLLERASDEAAPQLQPVRGRSADQTSASRIESLDSLSVDIARMIDHDAAVDLWDRYRRGERNVFTRRLYTLQGQEAYDDMRRRYRRDAEFKKTVDAYIDQFERLLVEVAGNDRDSMVARTYLTSETGKVYTMLAHASGRFD